MKAAAGIFGAVLGFFWGILMAAASGLHEPLQVFLPAFVAAAVASFGFITLSNRFSKLAGARKGLAHAIAGAAALAALLLFFSTVIH